MAVHPDNQKITIAFDGGTVRGPRGLLAFIYGGLSFAWAEAATTATGRLSYRGRQKSNAAAGAQVFIKTDEGETYSVRVTGSIKRWVDRLAAANAGARIENIYTARGTEYGKFLQPSL